MKKFVFLMTLIVGILVTQIYTADTTFAKSKGDSSLRKIAIVIVSDDPTYRAKYYAKRAVKDLSKDRTKNGFKFIPDGLRKRFESDKNDFVLVSGEEVQDKYHEYWVSRGYMQEGTPSKDTMINFANYSGYDKVVFLLINKSMMQQTGTIGTQIANPTPGGGSVGTTIYTQTYEASLTMDAFLVDKTKIIQSATTSQVNGDKWSSFKRAIREICPKINPSF